VLSCGLVNPRYPLLLILAAPLAFAAEAILSGRVLDADTGRPIPATVAIREAGGNILTDNPSFAGGFRCADTFEKRVPPGLTTITVSRGLDYGAETREVKLGPGERRTLLFRLKRRTPLGRLGWVCGDSHVHMIHGERTVEVDFPYVALAGRAEGLDYLSVCQQWNLPRITPEDLDRACQKVSTADFRLSWNLEAPKNYWRGDSGKCIGHGWTAGMRGRSADGRDAIAELLEMSAWDYESEKPPAPNFEIQRFIHKLGGIVSYTHPHRWWWGEWGGRGIYPVEKHKFISNMAQELPFDTVAGPTYDTLDIMMRPEERDTNRRALELWFLLLNHGYRLPATASSDTTFDNPGGGVPGKVRVYTLVGGEPTPAAVARAMKAGRNFVTSGPLLLVEIGGHAPGDVIHTASAVKLEARLRAWGSGAAGERLGKVELIRNGEVVRSWQPGSEAEFAATAEVKESGTAWYAARCFGAAEGQVAITNPIYFEGRGYRAPQPTPARVTGAVSDRETGAPLEGVLEIVSMDGRKAAVESTVPFHGGRFEITAPATARLRARVEGYDPELKSVFMDYRPLLEGMLNMNAERLSDWRTYEQIRELLGQVRLEFPLSRAR
jgi:hypothetical protein